MKNVRIINIAERESNIHKHKEYPFPLKGEDIIDSAKRDIYGNGFKDGYDKCLDHLALFLSWIKRNKYFLEDYGTYGIMWKTDTRQDIGFTDHQLYEIFYNEIIKK